MIWPTLIRCLWSNLLAQSAVVTEVDVIISRTVLSETENHFVRASVRVSAFVVNLFTSFRGHYLIHYNIAEKIKKANIVLGIIKRNFRGLKHDAFHECYIKFWLDHTWNMPTLSGILVACRNLRHWNKYK